MYLILPSFSGSAPFDLDFRKYNESYAEYYENLSEEEKKNMLGLKFEIKVIDSSILLYRSSLLLQEQLMLLEFSDLSVYKVSQWGKMKSEFLEDGVFQNQYELDSEEDYDYEFSDFEFDDATFEEKDNQSNRLDGQDYSQEYHH
jgi:hypothetical protein